jgi:hypothetical protein
VEFPLADLLVSGRIPEGGLVLLDRRDGEEHLHFTVTRGPGTPAPLEIAVAWEDPSRCRGG